MIDSSVIIQKNNMDKQTSRANALTPAAATAIARLARSTTGKAAQGQIAGKPARLKNPQLAADKSAFFFFTFWDYEQFPTASNARKGSFD